MRSPSAKPFALATDQLPVAIALAPLEAMALALPASQMLKRTNGLPGIAKPGIVRPCASDQSFSSPDELVSMNFVQPS
jgi:hypothetical protein